MSALSPMPQDRPNSIEAFCDQLLAGLGSVREGRRSLEQMVGELSDDEQELDDIERRTTRTTPSRSTPRSAGRARAGAMRATTPCTLSRR